ncbi:TniQ family protein [Caulobacter hibisci]|uniref:TniQ family protein n=1 Tax=Caulobacter hibisci TaxID=2035993 RepID=A0ABS0SWG5_9CAUL|nr:TniQ family protein [Caulobacter hibisci]
MRGAFAYAPPLANDELLGSWIHRVAIGHGVSGSAFLQGEVEDVDWTADENLLRWLARGSGRSVIQLRSCTLSHRVPKAQRTDFAMASGQVFPGCHAYCPGCGVRDREDHGEAVQRQANAGLWRIACPEHGLLLDGVDDEAELEPAPRRHSRPWLEGRLPVARSRRAPAFVFAFERAVRAARAGRRTGRFWMIEAPEEFLALARTIANLALVRAEYGVRGECAAAALVGGRLALRIGVDFFDPQCLDRVSTRARVHALTATAMLMLSPSGVTRLDVAGWPPLQPLLESRRPPKTAWEAAGAAWDWDVVELLLPLAGDWPAELKEPVEVMVALRRNYLAS